MNSSLGARLFSLLLITCLFACTKSDQPEPENTDENSTLPSGALYIDCGGKFRKINVADSTVVWERDNINLFGSSGSALVLDSSVLYSGSTDGVLGLGTKTGDVKWFVRWPNYSASPLKYREAVASDSLVFFTSSTNGMVTSTLHCLNKNTGVLIWSKQVDSGAVSLGFNTTPVLVNDKVILITQDVNNHKHLTAYQMSNGARVWSSGVDDSSPTRLRAAYGRIYSTSGEVVTCYNATDGSIKWQVNEAGSSFFKTATFFENERLIVVRIYRLSYDVYIYNAADGTLVKETSIQAPSNNRLEDFASGCIYNNDRLVVSNRYGYDSVNVRLYNLSNQTMLWERRLEHNIGSYDYDMPTPLLANNYIIFAANKAYTNGQYPVLMYFMDLEGKDVAKIPFVANINITNFSYQVNGVVYNQDHRMIRP